MALFNRKNKEDKKHKGENIIGKIIYGFLLFAPLLSILVTCMYVTFNKNAYKSYSNFNENENQYVNINSFDDLVVGRTYKFISSNIQNANLKTSAVGEMIISNVVIEQSSVNTSSWDLTKINNFIVWNYQALTYFKFGSLDNSFNNYSLMSNSFIFSFTYEGLTNVNFSNSFEYYFDKYVYENEIQYQNNTLDNAFEYGIYKVEQNNIFNWSKETGTYTILETTCNGIGITNTFIPMLMSYWLLISVIYFLFDIALILVWAVHDKIHELKDNI